MKNIRPCGDVHLPIDYFFGVVDQFLARISRLFGEVLLLSESVGPDIASSLLQSCTNEIVIALRKNMKVTGCHH